MGCGSSKPTDSQEQPSVSRPHQPPEPKPEPEPYHPFTEFPTPLRLAEAQVEYAEWREKAKPGTEDDPFPPPRKKEQDFPPGRFDVIDEHVLETPEELAAGSMQLLVDHLMQPATNDADKVRGIFVWIASQNLLKYKNISKEFDRGAALYYLICAKANIGSYTTLFNEMCKCASIPCKIVKGRAKGAIYRLGEDIVYGNTWCVVLADGCWRLVDQNFGSCFVTGYEDDQWELVSQTTGRTGSPAKRLTHYSMDEFYFFTDPEAFIYDHFAAEEPVQLLARPITHSEYIEMAHLHQYFFQYDIMDTNHPKCVISCDTGVIDLQLTLPKEKALQFTFELYKMRGMENLATFNKETMKDYVIMDYTPEKDTKRLNVKISMKYIGKYRVVLLASDRKVSPNVSGYICEYLLRCERPVFNPKPILRSPEKDEFGPGADAMLLGITPVNYHEGVISTEDGIAVIRFKCDDQDFEFQHALKSSKKELQPVLREYNRHYKKDDEAVFYVKTPEHGTYLLELYARRTSQARKSFTNICNYLLFSEVGCTDLSIFPESKDGRVGATSKKDPVLIPVSHPEAIFQVPDRGSVEIQMRCRTQLDVQLRLELHTETYLDDGDCSDFTWYEVMDDELKCFLRFPRAGMYSFTIFTKEADNVKGVFVETWNYIITVDQVDDNCVPYPKALNGWRPTYSLKQPLDAYLLEDELPEFEIVVSGAEDVVLMKDNALSNRSLNREAGDAFKGAEKADGPEITICAGFGDSVDYMPLLEFKVLTPDEAAQIKDQQSRSKEEANLRLQELENRKKSEQENAAKRKEEEQRKVAEEENRFEINKEKYWEEENKLEKEAAAEYEEMRTREEEKLRQHEASLSQAEVDKKLENELKKIAEAKDSEKLKLKQLQAAQKAHMTRQNMRDATKRRNREDLGPLIKRFIALKLEEENGDLTKGQNMLSLLEAQHALQAAMSNRSIEDIEEGIKRIKLGGHYPALQGDVQQAENMLRSLKRLHHAKLKVLQMETKTMSEICRYRCPPAGVHQVMKTTLLLLQKNEEVTSDWQTCRKLSQPLGENGLKRRLHKFDIQALHPEIGARCKELLQDLEFGQIQAASAGAATFYVWAMATLEQAESMSQKQGSQTNDSEGWNKSANITRQKQIFGDYITQDDSKSPRRHQKNESKLEIID